MPQAIYKLIETFSPYATTTIGIGDFSQDYDDLLILANLYFTGTPTVGVIHNLCINTAAGALSGNSTTWFGSTGTRALATINLFYPASDTRTASTAGFKIRIKNYSRATLTKRIVVDMFYLMLTGGVGRFCGLYTGYLSSSITINRLFFVLTNYTYQAGCTFSVYGINR